MIAVPRGGLMVHPVEPDPEPPADFSVTHHGSITLIHCRTDRAYHWIYENVAFEGWQWFGGSFVVEPRYLDLVVQGMLEDGLVQE